jgi:hypothetical protein
MADRRQSTQEIRDAKKAVRQSEMDEAVANGRLVVRQMTQEERAESDVRFAAGDRARAARQKRRYG